MFRFSIYEFCEICEILSSSNEEFLADELTLRYLFNGAVFKNVCIYIVSIILKHKVLTIVKLN